MAAMCHSLIRCVHSGIGVLGRSAISETAVPLRFSGLLPRLNDVRLRRSVIAPPQKKLRGGIVMLLFGAKGSAGGGISVAV